MSGRRTSARQAAKSASNPSPDQNKSQPIAGSKRKADVGTQDKPKRGRKANEKEQTTIDSSMSLEHNGQLEDVEMEEQQQVQDDHAASKGDADDEAGAEAAKKVEDMTKPKMEVNKESKDGALQDSRDEAQESKPNGFDAIMKKDEGPSNETPEGTGSKVDARDNAVEVDPKREEAQPSNILQKGIIYFFFRGRVGVEEPGSVNDIARSYIVLRPLPDGAKLGEGPIGDTQKNKMLALPKKVLPISPKDRFMTFVEQANVSMDSIKERLSASDYSTKTVGVRHTPAANPIAEGVYAITQTGRDTHLAYIITIPGELGDVQKGVGLRQRGSYFTSAKNPQSSAPANAQLPQPAEYPKEILDEFGGRGWMPLQPHLLNYQNTQFLIIGHGDDSLGKAAKAQDGEEDEEAEVEKETPLEEIEKLESEDQHRVEGLAGNHAVFADLGLVSKEFSKLQTTW